MKICRNCGFENPDTVQSCERCCSTLFNEAVVPDKEILDAFFEKQEQKEKRHKILKTIPIPLYVLIYIPVLIKCTLIDSESFLSLLFFLLFPTIGYYLLAFKAEALFKLQHVFHIDNIDDVEVSDWYIFSSLIAGFLLLGLGIFVVLSTFFAMNGATGPVINVG